MKDHKEDVEKLCADGKQTLFWASNFSIGVAIFSAVNRYLAKIMNGFPQYSVCMQETHHVHKLDAPSGTAITLAEEIIDNIDRKKDWKRGVTYWTEDGHHDEGDANITDEDLVINCVRDGEVPGIHAVMYDSDADMITMSTAPILARVSPWEPFSQLSSQPTIPACSPHQIYLSSKQKL